MDGPLISHFSSLLRTPLNVLPNFVLQVAQTKVALDRIAVYLDEEEVTAQVSSLKSAIQQPMNTEEEVTFGLEDATLKWNVSAMMAKPEEGKTVEGSGHSASAPSEASEVESVTVRSGVSEDEAETNTDHQFRLEQISVIFPENKLTVITGPTASGSSIIYFTPPKRKLTVSV